MNVNAILQQVEQYQKERDQSAFHTHRVQKQNEALKKENQKLLDALNQANEKFALVNKETGTTKSDNRILSQQCNELQETVTKLHKQVEAQQAAIAKLQEELTDKEETFIDAHRVLSGTNLTTLQINSKTSST